MKAHEMPDELKKAMYERNKRIYELSKMQLRGFEKLRVKTDRKKNEPNAI